MRSFPVNAAAIVTYRVMQKVSKVSAWLIYRQLLRYRIYIYLLFYERATKKVDSWSAKKSDVEQKRKENNWRFW